MTELGESMESDPIGFKETNRAHARSSFKLGAGFIGIVAAGSLMIFTQFLTLGLLTLAVGGGVLGGYLMRIRQEVAARQKEAFAISNEKNLLLRFILLRVIPAKFTSTTEQQKS